MAARDTPTINIIAAKGSAMSLTAAATIINMALTNGEVVLSGKVDRHDKHHAEDIAEGMFGVRSV